MKIIYSLKEYGETNEATVEKGRKAFQDLLVITAKTVQPHSAWLVWLLSRFYYKTKTKSCGKWYISYNFFLL